MGKVIAITGPSGAGKSTLIQHLLDEGHPFIKIASLTTRARRERDRELDYLFVTHDEFEEYRISGQLLEFSYHYGNWYGTFYTPYLEAIKKGLVPIKDIDVNGAKNFKEKFKDLCLTLYISAPSFNELKKRVEGRDGFISEERINRIKLEEAYKEYADVVLVNDNLDTFLKEAKKVIHDFIASKD